MYRMICRLVLVVLLAVSAVEARAFSLLGDFESWQVNRLGYAFGGDLGGPMGLGNEYRWDVPTIVYAFDQTFLNYFGTAGVTAVQSAIKILNDLPPASSTKPDLSDIPLDTLRVNPTAESLNLLDLKTAALHTVIEELGLADPERYVWTLRAIAVVANNTITNYVVFGRSFDPVSLVPSPYINGTLYTYSIQQPINVAGDASTFPVPSSADGSFFPRLTVAGVIGVLNPGQYFVGLTRDDVGGLRYLLNPRNYNVENLPPNTTVIGAGTVTAGNVNLAWLPVGGVIVVPGTGNGGVFNPVVTALRPGRNKLKFVRANFDSLLGFGFQSITNDYSDPYVSGSQLISQKVRRVINAPDLIFAAADLGFTGTAPGIVSRSDGKVNNGGINGTFGGPGPGVVRSQIRISFTTVLPLHFHTRGPGDGPPTEADLLSSVIGAWGSFDGSDTPPVVFPDGLSISDLENLILQGQ